MRVWLTVVLGLHLVAALRVRYGKRELSANERIGYLTLAVLYASSVLSVWVI